MSTSTSFLNLFLPAKKYYPTAITLGSKFLSDELYVFKIKKL
jgi:hypothetical protein